MEEIRKLLAQWADEAQSAAHAHDRAARKLLRQHYMLGIPTIVVTAVVATAVFASLATSVQPWAKVLVGAMTIAATVMSSLQTFLNLGSRAEQHKLAETEMRAYRKDIQMFFLLGPGDDSQAAMKRLEELNARWTKIASDAPALTTTDWQSLRALPNASANTSANA